MCRYRVPATSPACVTFARFWNTVRASHRPTVYKRGGPRHVGCAACTPWHVLGSRDVREVRGLFAFDGVVAGGASKWA